ncbi:MAG: sulfotransferase [Deltaproteobacteria bacterium]|nr:sulfotransferase [Deltaproteobacteria bacterium]
MAAPIFVVGTGRSGTTLLRMMLSAHPRVYLTHEASFHLMDSMFPAGRSGEEFLGYFFRSASFRWLRLDPREVMAGLERPLTRARLCEVFEAVMRVKAAQHGKERFGDKTPSHTAHLARIYACWPGARVVRIVRDPRMVVRSLRSMPWGPGSVIGAAAMCEIERRQVAPFVDRTLKVRLEDLLEAPRDVMARVLDFVGEPWSDQVLDHPRFGPGVDDMPPLPWFARAARAPAGPIRQDWASWDPVELRLVERLTRDCMTEDGYAPAPASALASQPSGLRVFGRWVSELPRAMAELGTAAGALRRSRRDAAQSGAEMMALFRKLNPRACEAYAGFAMPDPPALPEGWETALAPAVPRLASTQ